jgi:Prealbumin-like fold domain
MLHPLIKIKMIPRKLSRTLASLIMLFAFSSVVFASSYSTTFTFSSTLTGATRYFDGTNVSFYTKYATSSPSKHATNKTYTASLYRDNSWAADDKIGTVTLTRDTSGTAKWSGVGAGNYYVYLSKAIDGITLTSSKVTISNY